MKIAEAAEGEALKGFLFQMVVDVDVDVRARACVRRSDGGRNILPSISDTYEL